MFSKHITRMKLKLNGKMTKKYKKMSTRNWTQVWKCAEAVWRSTQVYEEKLNKTAAKHHCKQEFNRGVYIVIEARDEKYTTRETPRRAVCCACSRLRICSMFAHYSCTDCHRHLDRRIAAWLVAHLPRTPAANSMERSRQQMLQSLCCLCIRCVLNKDDDNDDDAFA